MSGGSYNYLCYKDAGELVNQQADDDLDRMVDRLAGLAYAQDAAAETEHLVLTIRQTRVRLQVMIDRLRPIWEGVEWWDSCDRSEEQLKEKLKAYRGG